MPIEIENFEIDVQSLMRGLVHELRNPLSAILTASTLLPETANLDAESAMLLDVVRKESRRMNHILTEFASFVKPPKPNLQECDCSLLAREIVQSWQRDVSTSEIAIHDDLPDNLNVFADPQLIQQALTHLWNNAIEAIPHGGEVWLHGETKGGRACLLVCDSGPGLTPEMQEKAFQPFFSTKGAATGLGLSIARMTVRVCGGDCRIENGEVGARATIELPLKAENSA